MPQLQNDEVIAPSLIKCGLAIEDAYDYSIVGCVEPGGTGNEWSASGNNGSDSVWDMMEVIQLMINGGVNPGPERRRFPARSSGNMKALRKSKRHLSN
jgi:formate C-acetyltransferase